MKKTIKGALAVTAAGTLLLGGAGTLAYWTDASTVNGGTITGGTLSLVDPTCTWKLAHTGATTRENIDPLTIRLVPGDTATQTCTSTVTSTGQNLAANLTVTTPLTDSGTLASTLTPVATFTVGGETVTRITSADDGEALATTVVVAFPFGATADNTTNGAKTEVLSDYVITATQVDSVA